MKDIDSRITDLEAQSKRFASHLESEQRVYNQHGERLTEQTITIKMMSDTMKELKDQIKDMDKYLRNGNGISVRIDRLEQAQKAARDHGEKWIAWGAVIVSIISVVFQIIRP